MKIALGVGAVIAIIIFAVFDMIFSKKKREPLLEGDVIAEGVLASYGYFNEDSGSGKVQRTRIFFVGGNSVPLNGRIRIPFKKGTHVLILCHEGIYKMATR